MEIKATEFLEYMAELMERPSSEERTRKLLKLVCPLQDYPRMRAETEEYIEKLLVMMDELPPSPGREKRTPEQISKLRAQCLPVDKSFAFVMTILQVVALAYRAAGQPERDFGNFMWVYFDNELAFRKYRSLSRWLYRRTSKGKASQAKYEAKPERKAAKRANRPSKEEHREAERQRYWAAKGMQPPPRREAPKPLAVEEETIEPLTDVELETVLH